MNERMKKQMHYTFEVDANYAEVVCDCGMTYGAGTYGTKIRTARPSFGS